MEPQNARSRRTREAVLEAAHRLVEEGGFAALTMAAVAEGAGVTRRSLYLHFESRTALVVALFDHVNDEVGVAASGAQVWAVSDARDLLAEWFAHLARCQPRLLRVARAVQQVKDDDPDAAAHWDLVQQDWRASCLRVARRLAQGEVLDPGWTVREAADLLLALMGFDVLETLLGERGWSESAYRSRLTRAAERMLLASAPSVASGP